MVRCFITGDIHRTDYERFNQFGYIQEDLSNSENYVIVLGDFGINFYTHTSDFRIKEFYNDLAQIYNFYFIAIRGNHEYRPEDIPSYKKVIIDEENLAGQFLIEPEFPRLLFCYSYGQFKIGNKLFYQIGGAYSVDKEYRLMTGKTWVENEQLSPEEREFIEQDLNDYKDITFDYVLTHTCPLTWEPTHLFLSGINQSKVDKSTEIWLDKIEKNINYKKWFFGHYHADEVVNEKAEMLFRSIKEIEV